MIEEKICKHLRRILISELSCGNAISNIYEVGPMGGTVKLDILFERRLNLTEVKENIFPDFVKEFENHDEHYSDSGIHGFFCEKCGHGISGPI